MGNNIQLDQNRPELIRLLKAQRVAYTEAKKVQNFEWWVQITSLVSPLVGILLLPKIYEQSAIVLTTIFTVLNIVTFILAKKRTSEGATIQEQFDIELFGLPWNSYLTKEKIDVDVIIKLSKKYTKDDLKDWYSKEIHQNIRRKIAVLLCQKINLVWDNDLRAKFINTIFWFTIIYVLLFISYLIYIDKSFQSSLLLFVPIIPFIAYISINISNQKDILTKKLELKAKIKELFENFKTTSQEPTDDDLRSIQNLIFQERNKPEKIHNWFYRLYKKDMEEDLDELIRSLIQEYHLAK
ncbi:S-4TM family putative pore-forming effector [Flectobacillus sp. DC10W]|uniref:S-4TM family putative pore-forming effector n=1 Tax=Flectobacillus longus TaxID=2984207 RepID=A0ABT6YWW1_9BACT|nr:S-4TM family putative pore-forming effector [Flectobacillus longus]MDI9867553.1 S-4TM family putative pore-forming effector [Flectobacillus longus]